MEIGCRDVRFLPSWYAHTTPDAGYPGIDESIRELVYLLRNNGFNTVGSCGSEYKGLVIIDLYGEQMGWMNEHGGPAHCLRVLLREHGYEHFEIIHQEWTWHGQLVERQLILKVLGPEWDARWRIG